MTYDVKNMILMLSKRILPILMRSYKEKIAYCTSNKPKFNILK